MKTVRNLNEAQLAINELFEFKQRFESQNTDLRGRRFTNVGDAVDTQEYVTLKQLRAEISVLVNSIGRLSLENERLEKRIKILES